MLVDVRLEIRAVKPLVDTEEMLTAAYDVFTLQVAITTGDCVNRAEVSKVTENVAFALPANVDPYKSLPDEIAKVKGRRTLSLVDLYDS